MNSQLRRLVWERAGYRCEYCRLAQEHDELTLHVEHIVARQHGGQDEEMNLALACQQCNAHKGPNLSGIDPETNEVVLLFHPRRDDWSAHFALESARIAGLTATGRATVHVLNMNSEIRVELRAHLLAHDKYSV